MATLSKQHGRYFIQFYHKRRRPKRKRVSLRTAKKRDAEALRSKLEHDYLLGQFDPWKDDPLAYDRNIPSADPITCSNALQAFLEAKTVQGRKGRTVKAYRWFVEPFVRKVGEETLLKDMPVSKFATSVSDQSVAKRRASSQIGASSKLPARE